MATTKKGIYYPNDGTKSADVLADFKEMAESIDKTIEDEVKANIYDDTEIKKDISDIQQEQTQQNKDIENLQTNDNKQDELISKLKNVALNAETEEAKSLYVTDANKFGQLEVLGNQEQETRSGKNLFDKNNMNILQGYIDGSGSIIYNTSNKIAYIECPKNTDITVSGKYLRGIACYNQLPTYNLQTSVKNINQATYLTLNTGDNTYLAVWYYENNSGYTEQEITDTVQVEVGNVATEYEQYGASPSPGYSSPVKCLGSNKQLFDKSTAVEGLLQGDGSLSNSDNNYSTSDYIKVVPKKSYYKTTTGSSRFKFFDEDKNPISNTYNDLIDPTKAQSLIIPENVHYIRFTFLKSYIDEIKIEEGEQPTSYSPFGQGSTKISNINENFLDLINAKTNEATYTFQNDVLTVKSSSPGGYNKIYIDLLELFKKNPGKTIIFQFEKLDISKYNSTANGIVQIQYTKNNVSDYPTIVAKDGSRYEFNIPEDVTGITTAILNIFANNTNKYVQSSISITKPMLLLRKLSENKIDYVEHKQEDYLLYIQQEMLKGDYFIKELDGWKEVHNYSKKIFDGMENWKKSGSSTDDIFVGASNLTNAVDNYGYSNYFKYNHQINIGFFSVYNNGVNIRLCVDGSQITTVDEFKAWLQEKYDEGNPVYVFYKTTTPTKLACTPEQSEVLEELNNLDLFEGVNNIITAEDIALLKLKYALDVETYIDNKLNTINQQILEIAGGN